MRKLPLYVLLASAACASFASADVVAGNNCFPPAGSFFVGEGPMVWGGGAALVLNPTISGIAECDAMPDVGVSFSTVWHAQIEGDAILLGNPFGHLSSAVEMDVRSTGLGVFGADSYYDTELLSMNIIVGSVMVRESPTLASSARTIISDLGGGQYRIHSFFDIFTEISIDGGASWVPSEGTSTEPPGGTRFDLVPAPGAATLLGLAGLVATRRRRA